MTQIYPVIDYKHILMELAVNRKDPCEVVRELISNSYDAHARSIWLAPLLQYGGFAFIDDGDGLSDTLASTGISPYQAFFSVGRSTKPRGEAIGYKCQGSKLCFASSRVAVITRCEGESSWRTIVVDNPRESLSLVYDVSPRRHESPWDLLRELLPRPEQRARALLESLDETWFRMNLAHGTLVLVFGLDAADFARFYDADKIEKSYLWNYVRFSTRHGDVRVLDPERTGFSQRAAAAFGGLAGFNDATKLLLQAKEQWFEIPHGFPYLSQPPAGEEIRTPDNVSRLRDGSFFGRAAKVFSHEQRKFALVLAIDGNRRALASYSDLDRQGRSASGIRLTDQRGVVVCARGVKAAPFSQLFDAPALEEFRVLATGEAQAHYTLFIDGDFDLVTNRDDLSESSIRLLRSEGFTKHVREFLEATRDDDNKTLRLLVNRLLRESHADQLDQQMRQLKALKDDLQYRARFSVQGVSRVEDHRFYEPQVGEEHWVGALYALFSHLVPADSQHARHWPRPLTFAARGIDSVAVHPGERSVEANVLRSVEYKYHFSPRDLFNHPFTITNTIVCWTFDLEGHQDEGKIVIADDYECFGTIHVDRARELPYRFVIEDVESRTGDVYSHSVEVLSLKELLRATFDVEWKPAPPRPSASGGGKKGAAVRAKAAAKGRATGGR